MPSTQLIFRPFLDPNTDPIPKFRPDPDPTHPWRCFSFKKKKFRLSETTSPPLSLLSRTILPVNPNPPQPRPRPCPSMELRHMPRNNPFCFPLFVIFFLGARTLHPLCHFCLLSFSPMNLTSTPTRPYPWNFVPEYSGVFMLFFVFELFRFGKK